MSREAVRVTRMELLKLKKNLEVAIRARNLLEEKRNVLAMELLDYIKKISSSQEKIDEKMRKAYDAFIEAQMALGKIGIRSTIVSFPPDRFSIEEKYRSIMGIKIPILNLIENKTQIPYNFLSTSSNTPERLIIIWVFVNSNPIARSRRCCCKSRITSLSLIPRMFFLAHV